MVHHPNVTLCLETLVHVFTSGDRTVAREELQAVCRMAPIQPGACVNHAAKGQHHLPGGPSDQNNQFLSHLAILQATILDVSLCFLRVPKTRRTNAYKQ